MGANIIGEIDSSYAEGAYSQTDVIMGVMFFFALIGFWTVVTMIYRHFFPPTQADKDYEMQMQIEDYLRKLK